MMVILVLRPEGGFVELVWRDGRVSPEGRLQLNPAMSGFQQSVSLAGDWPEVEDRLKAAIGEAMELGGIESSSPHKFNRIRLPRSEDMVPKPNLKFNGLLQPDDSCSEILEEYPGITGFVDGVRPLSCWNLDSGRSVENSMRGEGAVAGVGPAQLPNLDDPSLAAAAQELPSLPFSSVMSEGDMEDEGKVPVMATQGLGSADQGCAFTGFHNVSLAAIDIGLGVNQIDVNFASSSGVKLPENIRDAGTVIDKVFDVLYDLTIADNGKVGDQTGCEANQVGGVAEEGVKNLNHKDSSVNSGNAVERDAADEKPLMKRKASDNDDKPDAPTKARQRGRGEQLTHAAGKKPVSEKKKLPSLSSQAKAAKRSQAIEVHNLSERRKRDRIKGKMQALQELIPNCSTTDKSSLLDEVIEYLKKLKIQTQGMSTAMGAGMYMPSQPMTFPTGTHNMPFPSMPQCLNMGFGMGLGIGYGGLNASSSVMPVQGGLFPIMQQAMLPGAFGHPGQGMPPFHPISATPAITSATNGYGVAPITTVPRSNDSGPRVTTPASATVRPQGDQPPLQSDHTQSARET